MSRPKRAPSNRYTGDPGADRYEARLAVQGGCCAICEAPATRRFHVDHCHTSGMIRGVLCPSCNLLLGVARDDAKLLRRAIKYLERGRVVHGAL